MVHFLKMAEILLKTNAHIPFGTLTKGSKEEHDKIISEIANSMKDWGDPVDTLRLLFTEISSIASKS